MCEKATDRHPGRWRARLAAMAAAHRSSPATVERVKEFLKN
jgi:hypothetical protein